MDRRLFVFSTLALAACQTQSPFLEDGAAQRFVPVENEAALMAIVRGRTVEYTAQSNTGAGIRQTFLSNGTTVYGDQRRNWSIDNGKYCSSADLTAEQSEWECFSVDVNEAGTIIRWQRLPDAQQRGTSGIDTWYGRIL